MELPMACSLTAAEAAGRADEFRALARRALSSRERHDGQVVLRFRPEPGVAAQVEDLARRERECCPFLDIAVERGGEGVTLVIGADEDAGAALDAFYELAV